MSRFEPFTGIRYADGDGALDDLVAPPYDVISPERRRSSPPATRTTRCTSTCPRAEGDRSPYEVAAELFGRWQREGVLVRDTTPAFYTYRMDGVDEAGAEHHTIGVIGALELSRPGEGDVLPHEQTTPKAKSDRLEMLRSTRANLSPIWGLSPPPGLTDLLRDTEVVGEWTASDGTRHTLGRIDDPGAHRRDPRHGRERAGGDRRRAPPVRDIAPVPRRVPRPYDGRRRRGGAHHDARRRARRGRARPSCRSTGSSTGCRSTWISPPRSSRGSR